MKESQLLQDIRDPENVNIVIDSKGETIWININGVCRLRACRIGTLTVLDDRKAKV